MGKIERRGRYERLFMHGKGRIWKTYWRTWVIRKYLDEFASIDNIPLHELVLYELANDLILAESAIESTVCYKKIMKLASGGSCQKHRKMWFHMLKKYILITGNCWRRDCRVTT